MVSQILKSYEELFGTSPEIIASAPGRVNLIGEHIDYNGGMVLPFAIELMDSVAIGRRLDNEIHLVSTLTNPTVRKIVKSPLHPGNVSGWPRYPTGVVWALGITDGLNIFIDGKVPSGAGLSSSAAVECAVALALNALFKLAKTPLELALLAQKAENEFVGVPCGMMDQTISLMGKAGNALLIDCQELTTSLVPFEIVVDGLQLLIIDTQVHHSLASSEYAERRKACESVVKKLNLKSLRELTFENLTEQKNELTEVEFRRVRHVVTEILRVTKTVALLKSKRASEIGPLLSESHYSLRDDFQVSSPELDLAVTTALDNGALGARMIGGGFGGSVIALTHQRDINRISQALNGAFAERGFNSPRFFTTQPSGGARIDFVSKN